MNKREFLETAGAASTAAAVLLASGPIHAQTPATSVTVLVAYHSVTGNTEKMAKGVAEGVNSLSGTNVVLKKVSEVTTDDLLACDALIVGSPVYNANIAGEVKTFFDTKVRSVDDRGGHRSAGQPREALAHAEGVELTQGSAREAVRQW